jgi:hypothetical protein
VTLKITWKCRTCRRTSAVRERQPSIDEGQRSAKKEAAHQLEDEVAGRHLAAAAGERMFTKEGEEAAAQVGAEHQAERDLQRDHLRRRKRGGEQHDGEAREGERR